MAADHGHRRSRAPATVFHLPPACSSGEHQPVDDGCALKELLPGKNWSCDEVRRYGDLAMTAYEAFDNDGWSPYRGHCRYGLRGMLSDHGLAGHGYVATAFIYATVNAISERLEPFLGAERWDDAAHWIGYVAVAGAKSADGFRDVAVVWRGTSVRVEWAMNIRTRLVRFPAAAGGGGDEEEEKVAAGFHSVYAEEKDGQRSARDLVTDELERLVDYYRDEKRGEEVRVTFTGHSLGGALALLAARDLAARRPEGVNVRAVTFGAPRVGNRAFRDGLVSRGGVEVLRVVVRGDPVPWLPRVPGASLLALLLSGLQLGRALAALTGGWTPPWVYAHAGDELVLDVASSRDGQGRHFLKQQAYRLKGRHSLEVYLHLLAGAGRRDVALVNRASSMLREDMGIPARWFQPLNKVLTQDAKGHWVRQERAGDDKPKPNDKLDLHLLGGNTCPETAVVSV